MLREKYNNLEDMVKPFHMYIHILHCQTVVSMHYFPAMGETNSYLPVFPYVHTNLALTQAMAWIMSDSIESTKWKSHRN